jgi:predicted ATPase
LEIPIQLVGSTVKSLSSLIFYLKYQAKINDTLIIDEPEINLHPDNQIIVARILAQIVNRGIRLIISTHSDYILREFNHLLLMGNHKDDAITKEIMERYGYKTEEILNPEEVGAYIFHRNKDLTAQASEIIIDPIDGIQPDTINQVINQQNKVSSALYNRLVAENVE